MNVSLRPLQSSINNYSFNQLVLRPIMLIVAGIALAIFAIIVVSSCLTRFGIRRDYQRVGTAMGYRIKPSVEGLRSDPELSLTSLAKLVRTSENGLTHSLWVQFLDEKGEGGITFDAGGPTRQFFSLVFESMKGRFSNETPDSGNSYLHGPDSAKLLVPQGNPTDDLESSIFYDLGTIMMYVKCNSYRPVIGPVFHEAIYAAILSLEDSEIDAPYDRLTDAAKIRMCKALIYTQGAAGEDFKPYFPILNLLDRGVNATDEEIDNAGVKELFFRAYEKSREGGQFLLLDQEDEYGDHPFDMNAIRTDIEGFLKTCLEFLLRKHEGSVGMIGLTLFPIHTMAKGMKVPATRFQWQSVRLAPNTSSDPASSSPTIASQVEAAKAVQRLIQGTIDRKIIVSKINAPSKHPEGNIVYRQFEWIKDWIEDPNTTNSQVENLLKFWTGSLYIEGGDAKTLSISIQNQGVLLQACTCNKILNVYNQKCSENDKLLHNRTKEGFFLAINKSLEHANHFDPSSP